MKRIVRIVVVSVLLLAAIVAGGSLYMLSYSLRPDATMRAKNASSYEYMYGEYPFLRPWVDSLERTGALRDTVILGSEGERLHAIYAAAPRPTDRTAVIVHGYTDNAVRMLMIGYLYNRDLGCNILLPDLYYHGQSEGRAIRMGWKDRFDVLQWMDIANDIFGGDTRMVVHGISMGAATTMMVSGEEQQPYVKCFVEDCGYTSVRDQFSKELKEQFGLPAFPLLDAASYCLDAKNWEGVIFFTKKALSLSEEASTYITEKKAYGALPHDLLSVACFYAGKKSEALAEAEKAHALSPNDERIGNNVALIRASLSADPQP